MTTYDLAGRTSLACDDADGQTARMVAAEMDPLAGSDTGAAAVVQLAPELRLSGPLLDIQNPSRDWTTTASDGERFLLLAEGKATTVPDPLNDRPMRFLYEPGFPVGRAYARLIRPALQLSLHYSDALAVHSAAVELDGRAVLVAGWSESGKTETALALIEAGAGFLSDKWTVLGGDGAASAFPIGVGVRGWVLPYLPRLQAALPSAARRRLRLAAAAGTVSAPLCHGRGRTGALVRRAVGLADRAALTPSQLRAAYGQRDDPARRVWLGAMALLTNVPKGGVVCRPADPSWAAARLARSAAFERRELFSLLERRRYAFADGASGALGDVIAAEARILERLLADTPTFEVRAPFPTDPRTIAEAIGRRL